MIEPSTPSLTLEFEPEYDYLYIGRLSELIRDFMSLVGALGGPEPLTVNWIVSSVSKASPLTIAITPVGRLGKTRVQNDDVRNLPGVVLRGMAHLMGNSDRPLAFTDDALARARDLARLTAGNARMRLYSNGTSVDVTGQIAVNVDKILEPAYRGFGTVEGRLEAINIHLDAKFAIYDDLTGRRIECSIKAPLSVETVASAIGKRVSVEGEISYRSTGEIVSINPNLLTIFPPDEDLPSIADVLGIFSA